MRSSSGVSTATTLRRSHRRRTAVIRAVSSLPATSRQYGTVPYGLCLPRRPADMSIGCGCVFFQPTVCNGAPPRITVRSKLILIIITILSSFEGRLLLFSLSPPSRLRAPLLSLLSYESSKYQHRDFPKLTVRIFSRNSSGARPSRDSCRRYLCWLPLASCLPLQSKALNLASSSL